MWVKYKGKWVILKAGPWPKRYAFGSARGALRVAPARAWRGKPGEAVATLRRLEVGDAVAMTRAAADGTEDWAHCGRYGRWTLTATPRQLARDHARDDDHALQQQLMRSFFALTQSLFQHVTCRDEREAQQHE